MGNQTRDLTGQKFGRWTVVRRAAFKGHADGYVRPFAGPFGNVRAMSAIGGKADIAQACRNVRL
jgi:hypothetical protein